MRRLSLTDRSFLIAETREVPMHVGGLSLYRFPDGVDEQDFLTELGGILRSSEEMRPPFGECLSQGLLARSGLTQHWVPDENFDIDFHIRHSALPKPGRYRELFALTSRLHSTLLDRNRPLWEMHLIEGLQDRQFATYFKVHHSVIDGIGAIHLMNSMLSTNKRRRLPFSAVSRQAWEDYKQKLEESGRRSHVEARDTQSLAERLAAQLGSGSQVLRAMLQNASAWIGIGGKLDVPWRNVPYGVLSRRVSGSRRFVAQSWSYDRVRAVGKALEGTLNDAVLAMCAGGLRRYLSSVGELPSDPIKAMVPVSLRVEGDVDSTNSIGFIIANLATNIDDPAKRFTAICQSMLAGKKMYSGLSAGEASLFTQITYSPMIVTNLLSVGQHFPAFSLTVSNVPGPRKPMYWNGARLEGIYPASIVLHGQAMSITLISNAGQLDFGIIACRRSLPHVQRLIDFMEEALIELEEVAGLSDGADETPDIRGE
jgi:diacylglycerol O-acyltransferase